MGLSGAVQRQTAGSHIKAFSGKGRTLSSSGGSGSGSEGVWPSSLSNVASGSGRYEARPSAPGREERGRGRGGGVGGVSRLVQRSSVEREGVEDDDPMMAQVQLVAQKKLTTLRERERELQQQVSGMLSSLVPRPSPSPSKAWGRGYMLSNYWPYFFAHLYKIG